MKKKIQTNNALFYKQHVLPLNNFMQCSYNKETVSDNKRLPVIKKKKKIVIKSL